MNPQVKNSNSLIDGLDQRSLRNAVVDTLGLIPNTFGISENTFGVFIEFLVFCFWLSS